MSRKKNQTSLRTQLIGMIALGWVLPVILVAASGFYLLNRNHERAMRQELEQAGDYAVSQMAVRFETVLFESKTVSYDGVVRSAYRTYSLDGDRAALYRSVASYLKQHFSRRESVAAVFLSFWNEPGLMPYMSNQGEDPSRTLLTGYAAIEPEILRDMAQADTRVRLYSRDGLLYMARNLLDSRLKPYATVVMLCDIPSLTAPIASLALVGPAWGEIDDFAFDANGQLPAGYRDGDDGGTFLFDRTVDGHVITLHARQRESDLLADTLEMPALMIAVSVLTILMLLSVLRFFSGQVSRPVRTLVEANELVEKGRRGYQITQSACSREFDVLYHHFNSMSEELQNQFNLALEEQKTLHQARIKALQSQINPHFLNNTLEIINWESRIAGNARITAMIEALATMLNTSLNRDDNPQISLEEELHYTKAYLYIIKQRMGERLQVRYDIDEQLGDRMIPRMILQPLVENAIEHDLSRSSGGELEIRVCCEGSELCLSVDHNGTILPEDRAKLDRLLQGDNSEPSDRVHIGVRNVSQRLRLLYGDQASLQIREIRADLIRAELRLPLRMNGTEDGKGRKSGAD